MVRLADVREESCRHWQVADFTVWCRPHAVPCGAEALALATCHLNIATRPWLLLRGVAGTTQHGKCTSVLVNASEARAAGEADLRSR